MFACQLWNEIVRSEVRFLLLLSMLLYLENNFNFLKITKHKHLVRRSSNSTEVDKIKSKHLHALKVTTIDVYWVPLDVFIKTRKVVTLKHSKKGV